MLSSHRTYKKKSGVLNLIENKLVFYVVVSPECNRCNYRHNNEINVYFMYRYDSYQTMNQAIYIMV